ncbi:hypothetical protein CEB3_c46680 [Peptococcaceae bacterium CEB3]|nr:hypothetical protein CEB3_c46680 [Peptococcaceae bacterium CEB3]
MKKALVILVLATLFLFALIKGGIENPPANTDSSQRPRQVIENYFKFYNEKNRQGLLSTLTQWHNKPNMVFGFKDLIFMKLLSIGNDDLTEVNAYLGYGRGRINGIKPNNVVAYKVTYISLCRGYLLPSGIQTEDFVLIKENNHTPWLIDDMGQG